MSLYYVIRPIQPAPDHEYSVREIGDLNAGKYDVLGTYDTHEKAFAMSVLCNDHSTELVSRHDYANAIDSQCACNLGGLVHSFERVVTKLQFEARLFNHGTDWINEHPIVRLYAEQIMFLSSKRDWLMAHEYCEKRQ